MSSRTLLTIGLACVVIVGACLLAFYALHKTSFDAYGTDAAIEQSLIPPRPTENVDGINFELSTNTAQQAQGLSDRTTIPDNYAMLFVFQQDGQYGFWMKDMKAPLDMIWLTDNGTIASITPDALPSSYPAVFYPPEPIKFVLETRAGFAQEKGWTTGTRVTLPLPYGE
jgi:uncharacterized membrane protein (UPF0127 family)